MKTPCRIMQLGEEVCTLPPANSSSIHLNDTEKSQSNALPRLPRSSSTPAFRGNGV